MSAPQSILINSGSPELGYASRPQLYEFAATNNYSDAVVNALWITLNSLRTGFAQGPKHFIDDGTGLLELGVPKSDSRWGELEFANCDTLWDLTANESSELHAAAIELREHSFIDLAHEFLTERGHFLFGKQPD